LEKLLPNGTGILKLVEEMNRPIGIYGPVKSLDVGLAGGAA
jgi:hypothetical protein